MTLTPIALDQRQARRLAQALAGLRGLIGVVAFLAPARALKPWVGEGAGSDAGGRLLGRALGGRDVALGAGALLALNYDTPVRGWIEAGGLADTADAVATLVAFRRLPKGTRLYVLALTLAAVATAYLVAPVVDAVDGAEDNGGAGDDGDEGDKGGSRTSG